ncbi:MAG: OmpA family protein [Saprospiraceae bacterium]
MISKINFKNWKLTIVSSYKLIFTNAILIALLLIVINTRIQAQEALYTKPSWLFGAAGAANFNFYRGSTQQLNDQFSAPVAFHNGNSVSLYLAPLIEFHPRGKNFGLMLQAGYDNRSGSFDQIITPCNCPADLKTNLSYLTIEPSIRFGPINSNFYLYGGPRIAFNTKNDFTYKLGINPNYPNQLPTPDVKGELSNTKKTLVSMQIGAGYDIALRSQRHQTQLIFSPFVAYQPYFGQSPRSIETWNINTIRAGAALKFGCGKKIIPPAEIVINYKEPSFEVYAPKNITSSRRVREIFPLRNYIFFDLGSSEIPERYELLSKNQVKDFKEDQLDQFTPKNLSGRSNRQMVVYYNVLNILGDRLGKNPTTTIKLVGSSEKGPEEGKQMAESVKKYLNTIFGINESRIATEGSYKPSIPSEKPNSINDLTLLKEGDRRVSIETSSPILLMEFQGGPHAPLKPVEFLYTQDAPLDSYISFQAKGNNEAYASWNLEIQDEKGKVQYYGPFTHEKISIPGKSILGTNPKGDYNVTMIGHTKSGQIETKKSKVHMELWTPTAIEDGMRYSVIFEFDESKVISIYEKYLTDVVTPKITKGATVFIHGYTDIIGDEEYNLALSKARAEEVKAVIEKNLKSQNRNDVNFSVLGFGEDAMLTPFDNKYPEERYYNRTVIIDIYPVK